MIDPNTGATVTIPNVPPKEDDNPGVGLDPDSRGMMGDYAIGAAVSLHGQLEMLLTSHGISMSDEDIWGLVGVTPMIGVNDVPTEVFDLTEAQELLAFAEEKGLGLLGWGRRQKGWGSESPPAKPEASIVNCSKR